MRTRKSVREKDRIGERERERERESLHTYPRLPFHAIRTETVFGPGFFRNDLQSWGGGPVAPLPPGGNSRQALEMLLVALHLLACSSVFVRRLSRLAKVSACWSVVTEKEPPQRARGNHDLELSEGDDDDVPPRMGSSDCDGDSEYSEYTRVRSRRRHRHGR